MTDTRSVQHTPGPWTVAPCSNGGMIVTRGGAFGSKGHAQSIQVIPDADAHLIAAAPDMYEALRAIVALYGDYRPGEPYDDAPDHPISLARAALSKAEARNLGVERG